MVSFLFLFYFLSQAFAASNCVDQANKIYKHMEDSYIANGSTAIEPDIVKLDELYKKKCFQVKDIKDSDYLLVYYNPQTEVVGSVAKQTGNYYWHNKSDKLSFIALKGKASEFKKYQDKLLQLPYRPSNLDYVKKMATDAERKASCGEVSNIVSKMPPIRDQGATGWCNFYTSADLLSFATNKNISASYLGHLASSTGNGGTYTQALDNLVKKFGLCEEKTMPSNGFSQKYVDELKTFDDRATKFMKGQTNCLFDQTFLDRMPRKNISDLLSVAMKSLNADGSTKDIGFSKPAIVQHLALDQCAQDRNKLKNISENLHIKGSYTGFGSFGRFKKIDELLSLGKPVGVSYNYEKLVEGKPSDTATHWSVVVGRKYVNGQCMYQIRNSWGASSCTKASDLPCEPPGYFWVSALNLYQTQTGIEYVE